MSKVLLRGGREPQAENNNTVMSRLKGRIRNVSLDPNAFRATENNYDSTTDMPASKNEPEKGVNEFIVTDIKMERESN